jgi:general secretion pathway protein G
MVNQIKKHRELMGSAGFTLIEMIGVLAVIGVLAALIIPKVFDVIAQSKVDALASAVKTYETAVTKYYTDMGTILPLNGSGNPQTQNSGNSNVARSLAARLTLSSANTDVVGNSNLWPKFHGPYLEKFNTDTPPELGNKMYLPARGSLAYGVSATGTNRAWDLKGDDGKNDLSSDSNVVYFRLTGLSEEDFMSFDKIIDTDVGSTTDEKKLRGRAKWATNGGGTLYLYLAHR